MKILDDTIVHNGNAVRCDRMDIGFGQLAMCRPTGVPNADHALRRFVIGPPVKVDEFAFRPPAFNASVDQGPNPGRIIGAIFETP